MKPQEVRKRKREKEEGEDAGLMKKSCKELALNKCL